MEIEVQTSDQRQKGKMQIKLRSYRSEITKYKADLVSPLFLLPATYHSS